MALPVFQAAGAKAEGTTTCAPAWPTHLTLDVALLFVEVRFLDDIPVPGESWVQVQNSPQVFSSGGTTSTTLAVFWKRAASAAETAPTLNSANHIVAQIITFRGCIETGDPWEAGAGDGDVLSTASTAVAVPGGTTTVDDCLVVAACAMGQDTAAAQFSSWANADLANVLERADSFTALGNGGGFGVATGDLATAGTFAATTATSASSFAQARISLALKPAAVGGTEHFGAASLELTADMSTSGKKDAKGSAASQSTFAAAVTAKKDAKGSAAQTFAFNAAATGTRVAHAAASLGVAFAASTTGKKTAHGSAEFPLTFSFDVAGGGAITGSASLQMTFGSSVAGQRTAHASAGLPLVVSVATQGTVRRQGASSFAVTFAASVSATKTAHASAALPLTFTISSAGFVGVLVGAPFTRRTGTSLAGSRTFGVETSGRTFGGFGSGRTDGGGESGPTHAGITEGVTSA